MWYIASQIVLYLLLAALLGFLVGWFLRKRWSSDRLAPKDQASMPVSLQGELAAIGQNLKKLSARVGELESSVAQGKESEGKWQAMEQERAAALREKEIAIARLQTRVGELEPLTVQVAEREQRLRETDERLHLLRQEKETEISALRAELGEIKALRELLGERDNQLRGWDGRYTSAVREKDDEIGLLKTRIADLEALLKRWAEELEQAGQPTAVKQGR